MFNKLVTILTAIGYPYAYDHFAEGENVQLPFICYTMQGTDNFGADGKVYKVKNKFTIELYTEKKDLVAEKKITDKLDESGIYWESTETYIPSERLYEVSYTIGLI